MSQDQRKITEFEGLRGLLAWWVVGAHVLGFSGYAPDDLSGPWWFLRSGMYAVDVFIILSGFVVFFLLDRQRVGYGVFLIRRFFRLFPVYLPCLGLGAIGVLLSEFTANAVPEHPAVVGVADRAAATWSHWASHLVAHLTLLHGAIPNEVLPYSSGAFLDPAWSISLEWQFYLVAPLLFLLATRIRWGFILLSLSVPLLWKLGKGMGTFDFASFLPLKLHLFWLGGISYFIHRNFPGFGPALPSRDALVIAGLLAPLLFLQGSHALVPLIVWLPCLMLTLPMADGRDGWVTTWGRYVLNHPSCQVLGNVSYVTYLIHLPIIQFVRWGFLKSFPDASRFDLACAITLIGGPLMLVASIYLSRWVEKPGIELGRQIARRWSTRFRAPVPAA